MFCPYNYICIAFLCRPMLWCCRSAVAEWTGEISGICLKPSSPNFLRTITNSLYTISSSRPGRDPESWVWNAYTRYPSCPRSRESLRALPKISLMERNEEPWRRRTFCWATFPRTWPYMASIRITKSPRRTMWTSPARRWPITSMEILNGSSMERIWRSRIVRVSKCFLYVLFYNFMQFPTQRFTLRPAIPSTPTRALYTSQRYPTEIVEPMSAGPTTTTRMPFTAAGR